MSDTPMDASKRTWLIVSGCAGVVGGAFTAVPFVSSFQPSERAKAAGANSEPDRVSRGPRNQDAVLGRGDPPLMSRPRKYPEELLERGVRLTLESGRPIAHVAADLGIHPETLRKRVRQAQADSGKRTDLLSSQEREEIRRLRKENFELRRANEILKSASVFFAKELDQDRTR